MKKIRIAQIGTSLHSHGNFIWGSIKKQSDLFEIAGYAFPENEREKFPGQMAAFDGFREMSVEEILSDPGIEAVAVETEEIYLTKYALAAAKAGKHVHMEKPGGTDLKMFEKLVETLREKNLTFSTGYMYRFNPKVREALDKVKEGDLGEIYAVEALMDCAHNDEYRRWLKVLPGGMMFFLGCHLVDLIYMIMGEPEEIIPLNCSTGIGGIDSDDYGFALFRHKNGISFAKCCDCEPGGYLRRQLVICGSKGTIEIRPLEYAANDKKGGMYTDMLESHSPSWNTPGIISRSEIYDRYDEMIRNFALMVRGERENPFGYDYELGLYKTVLKACGVI